MKFKIRKDVPVPPRVFHGQGRKPDYPFTDMEVGDSMVIYDKPIRKIAAIVSEAQRNSYLKGRKYTVRDLGDGTVGVWRVS